MPRNLFPILALMVLAAATPATARLVPPPSAAAPAPVVVPEDTLKLLPARVVSIPHSSLRYIGDTVIRPQEPAVYLLADGREVNVWSLVLWFLPDAVMVGLALLAVWAAWRLWRVRRYHPSPTDTWCRRCGYALHDPAAPRCSECGGDLTARRGRMIQPRLGRRRLLLATAGIGALLLATTILVTDDYRLASFDDRDRAGEVFESPWRTHRGHRWLRWPSATVYRWAYPRSPLLFNSLERVGAVSDADFLLRIDAHRGTIRRVGTLHRHVRGETTLRYPLKFYPVGDRVFFQGPVRAAPDGSPTIMLSELLPEGAVRVVAAMPDTNPDDPGDLGQLVLSPDGRHLATAYSKAWDVRVWDTRTGRLVAELPVANLADPDDDSAGPPGSIFELEFDPSEAAIYVREGYSPTFTWRYLDRDLTRGRPEFSGENRPLTREPLFAVGDPLPDDSRERWVVWDPALDGYTPESQARPAVLPAGVHASGASVDAAGRLIALHLRDTTRIIVWDCGTGRWVAQLDAPGVVGLHAPFGFSDSGRVLICGAGTTWSPFGGIRPDLIVDRLLIYDLTPLRGRVGR